jgi:hypothetical protein
VKECLLSLGMVVGELEGYGLQPVHEPCNKTGL